MGRVVASFASNFLQPRWASVIEVHERCCRKISSEVILAPAKFGNSKNNLHLYFSNDYIFNPTSRGLDPQHVCDWSKPDRIVYFYRGVRWKIHQCNGGDRAQRGKKNISNPKSLTSLLIEIKSVGLTLSRVYVTHLLSRAKVAAFSSIKNTLCTLSPPRMRAVCIGIHDVHDTVSLSKIKCVAYKYKIDHGYEREKERGRRKKKRR